jgi:hypothetical protein
MVTSVEVPAWRTAPQRILRHRKRATIAASLDERLANDTLSLSRSEQHAHHRR